MVIAENVENFPGVKIGSDYLFHAKKLLEQSQMDYYFEKDIYEKKIGNSTYYVLEAKFDYLGQTLRQDYLSSVEKGFSLSYVASFATDEQREELYEILDNIKN